MNLAKICDIDINLLDNKIQELLEKDNELSIIYKEQLNKLIFSSGKRIRPIFTVLGGYFGNRNDEEVYKLAAIFEIVHTASLIHDDIIDGSDTRRGTQTLHIKNGNYNTLILGNYLVALTCEYISMYNFEDLYYDIFKITDLCRSEINQQNLLFDFSITFNEYISKTKNKTALLIAASLLGGAKLSGVSKHTLKILYNYAINLGISFQIIDDILDFTQEKQMLGKPNGADLMNGNITLPVIFSLTDQNIASKIKLLNENSSIAEFNSCINYIQNSSAIEKSKKVSKKYINKAMKAINKLNHPNKQMLVDILKELEKRTF